MKTLTLSELKEAINSNRVIFLKPKKQLFILDGSKVFKANLECINFYKSLKN